MYGNIYREWFLQIERMRPAEHRNYLCKVVEFDKDAFTIKGEVITEGSDDPLIIEKICVFSSPLITTQLRPDDFVILVDLGFNLGSFWDNQTIGNEIGGENSLIAIPLNIKPSKEGTTLQAPLNDKNSLALNNDGIVLQDSNNNSLKTEDSGATIASPALKLTSDAPLDLNGASFGNAMSAISSALTQISVALQAVKYTPGPSTIPPIEVNTKAIIAINEKIK